MDMNTKCHQRTGSIIISGNENPVRTVRDAAGKSFISKIYQKSERQRVKKYPSGVLLMFILHCIKVIFFCYNVHFLQSSKVIFFVHNVHFHFWSKSQLYSVIVRLYQTWSKCQVQLFIISDISELYRTVSAALGFFLLLHVVFGGSGRRGVPEGILDLL